ncbi:MAG: hypothetical protein LBN24_07695 [Mediterranea sp.]|nr:hypothetical protein [Mediterranea sp.]
MTSTCMVEKFSKHLFWDVRKDSIDLDKHAEYVIQQVLEYGLMSDWLLTLQYYGQPKIVEVAMGLRNLEPRALAYISVISHTPKEQFRCYITQQLIPTHWDF